MLLGKKLGFDIVSVEHGDGLVRVARFSCSRCPATVDVRVKPGNAMSPNHVALIASKYRGWNADAERKKKVLCPDCLNPPRPDKEAVTTNQEEEPEPMATVTPIKPTPAPAKPGKLSSDQRLRVRNYLDKHFDDSVGVYLDGMSDQKIAEALDIPRAVIEQMREAAYGPIRVAPEIVELRAELSTVRRTVEQWQAGLGAAFEKLNEIETRLEKFISFET